MSEQLAFIRKKGGGGGKYTETSLWTNSAPTSTFGAQAVTLSQSMADFKYLKIKVAPSTTSTSSQYFEDIVLVSELQRTTSSVQEGVRDRLVLGFARTTYDYERPYYYASSTSIYFMATAQAGTSTTNNSRNIPLEILGLNELDHGTVSDVIFDVAHNTTYSTATTINLTTDDLDKYKHLIFTSEITGTPLITNSTKIVMAVVPVDYFKSNNISATYNTGNSGSANYHAITISYVDKNTVRLTRTNTSSRLFNVYGIK